MRAIIKTSYFNQQKQSKVQPKPDKQKILNSCDKLHNFHLRKLATAFQQLMIHMIEKMKRDFNLIQQLSYKVNQRVVRSIFYAWKEQSQQPQPFKLQLPFSPPKKEMTSRSTAKKSISSKTPRQEIKFFTPGRDSAKTITQNSDNSTDKIAVLFRLRKVWNRIKLFTNFQRHLAFKARHFRNFYIIRKYFNKLQAIVFLKKAKLSKYEKSKSFYSLRVCFSKWYEFGARKRKHQFILMKQGQKYRLILLQKGLKALYINKRQVQKLQITQTSQNSHYHSQQDRQQKKLKLIPKKL